MKSRRSPSSDAVERQQRSQGPGLRLNLLGRLNRDERSVEAALPTDRAVSRRHASIKVDNGHLLLADAGSSNGTIVGGQAIAQPIRIELGQTFCVGRTVLRVLRAMDED